MEDRSWMYLDNRACDEYLKGVRLFVNAAEADMLSHKKSAVYCPCRDCKNLKKYSSAVHVHAHLIIRGFVRKYKYLIWNRHGEEGLNDGEMNQDQEGSPPDSQSYRQNDSQPDRDGSPMGQDLSDDDVVDIGASYNQMAENLEEMVRAAKGNDDYTARELAKLEEMMRDLRSPLYPGCHEKYTKLSTALKLLQLKAAHHWTDRSFKALVDFLRDMLPEGNHIPISTYDAKRIICPMGLEVEKIHACKEDCILFRGDNADLTECPVCGTSRYKRRKDGGDDEKSHGAPRKVVWYFPVIPRLKRLFACGKEAELLRWHKEVRKDDDDFIRHPADAIQWRNFDMKYGNFAKDARNIRFALSTDGMNPFGNMSSSHSVWPVLLSIYNLPPWLCNKRKYMMMPLLISGPHQPGNDIDVYLRPLVDDLKLLWEPGVEVMDACKQEMFTLHGMLFTTINDIPAHRSVSGQSKGEKDCFQCLDDTETVWLNNSKKRVYVRHRRFLPQSHPYRKMRQQFDGTKETASAPRNFNGQHVYEQVKNISITFGKKSILGKRKRKADANEKERWKKMSILWELPYWIDLTIRHSIDAMHLKKNLCDSMLGTLLNNKNKTKDHEKGRADLEDLDIRAELCHDGNSTKLPTACITLSAKEKKELCDFFRSVKVPCGYSSNISKLVSAKEQKMLPMKAHDCDVMITLMLAVGIRNILPEKVRMAIMSLCFFLSVISQKVIDERSLDGLERNLFETVCLLEAYFPPSFFDISIHLVTHLVKEVRYLGPVFLHHMYPYERFMSVLNKYTKNRAFPEGCMVQGYSTEEVVDWCLGFIDPENPIGIPRSRHEGRLRGRGILGEKTFNPEPDAYEQAHFLVLQHTDEVSTYIEEHKEVLLRENPGRNEAWLVRAHMKSFNTWFRDRILNSSSVKDESLRKLARGPLFTITSFEGYDINGYTFYTIAQDQKSTCYQNSGVRIDAYDNNMQKAAYYGQIEEIWELTYPGFKVPIFRCRWVHGTKGVTKDKYGFTTVDLKQVGYREEPFVLAEQVSQVFYVLDTRNMNRRVVLPGKRRIVGVENAVDEEEHNQFDEVPPFGDFIIPRILPSEKTPYLRTDHKEGVNVAKGRRKK